MAETSSRSVALDGLRGLAALAVVFYHAILHMDPSLVDRVLYPPAQTMDSARSVATKLALSLANGHTAVYIFFVLSGCVLTISLNQKMDHKLSSTVLSFMVARIIRLYPPVVFCMLFFYTMCFMPISGLPKFSFIQFMQNASLTTISMHGPSTTVQGELLAVPFIVLVWVARRIFGPIVLVLALGYAALALESGPMVLSLPNMHAWLIAFVTGMAIAEPGVKRLITGVNRNVVWVILAALVVSRTFHAHASLVSLLTMTGLAAALVAVLLYGEKSSFQIWLESAPLQSLGRISFSFYLFNVPVLYLIWSFTDRLQWAPSYALEAGIAIGIVSAVLTWPLAEMSERWIERPSIAAGRLVVRGVRAIASGPTSPPSASPVG